MWTGRDQHTLQTLRGHCSATHLRETRPQKRACSARARGLKHAIGIRQSLSITPALHADRRAATLLDRPRGWGVKTGVE